MPSPFKIFLEFLEQEWVTTEEDQDTCEKLAISYGYLVRVRSFVEQQGFIKSIPPKQC